MPEDKPAAKKAAAKKPAAKKAPVKPAKPAAKKAPAKPAKKAVAKAVPDAAAAEPKSAPRRRAALAADGSTARRRAAGHAVPAPVADPVPPPPAPPAPEPRWAAAEALGEAAERHPDEPVVPLAPPAPGLFDGPGILDAVDPDGRPVLVARVLRGNWRRALATAVPAVLATVALSALATIAVLLVRVPGSSDLAAGETGFVRFINYVCVGVGLAFGSPLSAETTSGSPFFDGYAVRFAPLTITLVALAVLWFATRNALRSDDGPDQLADSVRVAGVFAAGVALVSVFGRWSLSFGTDFGFGGEEEEARTTISVWPPKVVFWAFLAALAVGYLARRPRRLPVAVRGALVGLGTGIAVAFGTALVLAYVYADRVDATAADVTRTLPAVFAYAVNLGTAAFGIVSGGEIAFPIPGGAPSLWAEWVPDAYLALLVVPVLAVLAGSLYVTRRGGLPPADAARACARMALPAAAGWWLLTVAGSIGSGGATGNGSFGPRSWDALLVGLFFGAGGWLFGKLLSRRSASVAFDPPEFPPVP